MRTCRRGRTRRHVRWSTRRRASRGVPTRPPAPRRRWPGATRSRRFPRATRSSAARGPKPRSCSRWPTRHPTWRRSRGSRAGWAARARASGAAKTVPDELQLRVDALDKAGERYWAEQVRIQKLAVTAWVALAENRTADALASMREAADREDRTEKNAISPGPLAPARELLAEMLLQVNRPAAALAEFRKTIAKEPNRFRGIAGAAAAAAQAGDTAAARAYQRQLVEICAKGDTPGRPELEAARQAR